MVTSKQIKEKFRDTKRSFLHNWNLFKENKVGLLGLGIMLAFIMVAASVDFMGLKDPIDWFAPDEDVVDVENYLYSNASGIVDVSPAVRIIPSAQGKQVDRFYFAGGDGEDPMKGGKPFGIYAKSSADGSKAWKGIDGAFETESPVTSNLIGQNFGSKTNSDGIFYLLIFGTEDGTLYFVHDEIDSEDPRSSYYPMPLDGAVIGVDVYEESDGRLDYQDIIVATTDAGTLYIIDGEYFIPRAVITVPVESNATLTQPALSGELSNGQYVYVGSNDGMIYGYDTFNGTSLGEPYDMYESEYDYTADSDEARAANERRGYWSNYPAEAVGKVFATSDDGRIHLLSGTTMEPIAGWEGGYKINKDANTTATGFDMGNLTAPTVIPDGGSLVVGSSTGNVFRVETITRTDTSESMVRMVFDTTQGGSRDTTCVAPPYLDSVYSRLIFVAAKNTANTPDPTDDYTTVYSIDTTGTVKWRRDLDGGVAFGTPIVYDDLPRETEQHSGNEVLFITTKLNETGEPGFNADAETFGNVSKVYSFRDTGRMIAPLKPTWAVSEEEKPYSGNEYLLGTDAQGRDILSQVLKGSQIALLVGFSAAIFSISIGLLVGLVAGYYGGNVDIVLMRFVDVILTLPGLPLLIILAALMEPSVFNIVFIIGIVGWGGTARVIRSEVLTLKERPFIDSARVTGASKTRIMFKHIAPNILPLAVLYMTFYVSGAILSEASLSFIGLGDPRTMSWGMMLNYVQHANALEAWWWLLPPGLCITLICLSFFLLGRAFDEIVNPRLRRR